MGDLRDRIKGTIEQGLSSPSSRERTSRSAAAPTARLQALRGRSGFAAVDVLPDPHPRGSGAVRLAHDPQVFVAGELVGGLTSSRSLRLTGQLEATLDEKLGESWRRPGSERTVEVLGGGGGLRVLPGV